MLRCRRTQEDPRKLMMLPKDPKDRHRRQTADYLVGGCEWSS